MNTQLQSTASNPGLVRAEDLAKRYDVHPRTIWAWKDAGRLPFYRFGRKCVRFDPAACDKALERFHVAFV
ncbi:MAG: helix-turn-helix domain-containing protein [Chthoniobacteraceae bacterium]